MSSPPALARSPHSRRPCYWGQTCVMQRRFWGVIDGLRCTASAVKRCSCVQPSLQGSERVGHIGPEHAGFSASLGGASGTLFKLSAGVRLKKAEEEGSSSKVSQRQPWLRPLKCALFSYLVARSERCSGNILSALGPAAAYRLIHTCWKGDFSSTPSYTPPPSLPQHALWTALPSSPEPRLTALSTYQGTILLRMCIPIPR